MQTRLVCLIGLILLTSCARPPSPTPTPSTAQSPAATRLPGTPSPAATPAQTPTPSATPSPVPPNPRSRAAVFLDGWKKDDYPGMYGLLSAGSQAAITLEAFSDHFRGIAIETALKGIDYEILSVEPGASEARVSSSEARARYRVTFHSNLVPDWQNETGMTLLLENDQWRVKWEDTIVMASLDGANYLSMNREEYTPPRGSIYDRSGNILAGEEDVYAVGLNMLAYDPEQAGAIIGVLSRLSGQPGAAIQARIENAVIDAVPYLAFGEYPARKAASWESTLNGLPAIEWNTFHSRFYYGSPFFGAAPHLVGHGAQIDASQIDTFRRLGFRKDELIGQSGLEKWAESALLGKRGGELYVRDGNHQIKETLARSMTVPSQEITTTLLMNFQVGVQNALNGLPGAAVVIERDTGRVLAMASSPAYDPNAFAPGNLNGYTELSKMLSNPLNPQYNRATQGQYPLGSVFKIITMAAALESGLYNAESSYECGYFFQDIVGIKLHDWTWEHFQEDGKTQPSGHLTLPQGLIRSCNPFFYHIGQGLFEMGKPKAISDMARAFGLGSPTGIQGVEELPGNVPDPASIEDALYLASGQSGLQVTPLQVASFVAAVGNGGTLYTPQVIERIAPVGGDPSFVFQPKVHGRLPVKPENLALIQEAMRGVVASSRPLGTAYSVFRGMRIPVYGKTGTAQTGVEPHAWFAAYTDAKNPKLPDIAVAVIVENGGEGSEWAAPITRRIIELYFQGRVGKLFPWESGIGVWRTPEPTPTPSSN